jgi:hydroxymethylglutaryl-CoA lyase
MTSVPNMIIQEVAPRDGLQIEAAWVDTSDKIRLIDTLSTAGFSRIEVSSFVSPKAVPALRDAADVFREIQRRCATTYNALVPNRRGGEAAVSAGADEINFVMSASETHNLANMGMTHARSLAALAETVTPTHSAGLSVNATVATAFGCPFEGDQPANKIREVIRQYLDLGVDGITLADTTGMANPKQVAELVTDALALVSRENLTLHFHNTRGLGLVNVIAAGRRATVRRCVVGVGRVPVRARRDRQCVH